MTGIVTIILGSVLLIVLVILLVLVRRVELARRQLKASKTRLNQILEALPIGVFVVNGQGDIYYSNQHAAQIFNLPDMPDMITLEKATSEFPAYVTGTDKKYSLEKLPLVRALHGEKAGTENLEIRYQNNRIPLEIWAEPVFNEHNKVSYAVVTFRDITKRLQTENELEAHRLKLEEIVTERTKELARLNEQLQQDIAKRAQTEAELRKLSRAVEQSASTIVITNLDGDIEFVNPAFSRVTGYSQEEVIGQNPRILKSEYTLPEVHKQMWSAISTGGVWQGELVNRKKSGEIYWEFATISPVKDKDGNITHYLAVKDDITHRREAEEALKDSHQQLQEANKRLATIYEIGKVITAQLQLESVLDILTKSTAELLGTDTGVILLLDENTRTLSIKGAYGLSDYIVENTRDRLGESIAGRVAQSGQPLIVNDLPNDPIFSNPAAEKEGLLACASVPLTAGNKIIGTLDVHSKTDRFAFSDDVIDMLRLLAGQAAIAIENARLYTAAQQEITDRKQTEKTLQRRNRQLALINHASQAFSSTLELDEVIQTVLQEVHQILDIIATSYWLLVPEAGKLVCQQATGPAKKQVVGWILPVQQGFTGLAAHTGESIVVTDTRTDTRHFKTIDAATGLELRSIMAIPLRVKGEVIGVLNLGDTTAGRFSSDDLNLLEPIAAVAAGATKNAQLFYEAQRQQQIAESLRQVSTIINSSLDLETLLTQIMEQLKQVVQYDSSGLFLAENNDLVMLSGADLTGSFIGFRIPLDSINLTTRPFKQKQVVVIGDVQTDPGWIQWNDKIDVRSWMGAPLILDDEPIGVLTVDRFDINDFQEIDAQMLQAFATQAAIAIKNARLFNQEQHQRKISESLREVAFILNQNLEQSTSIDKILGHLGHVVKLDSAAIFLYDHKDESLVLINGTELAKPYIGNRLPLSSSAPGVPVFQEKAPILISNTQNDSRWDKKIWDGIDYIRCWMCVPLLADNEAIGILTVDNTIANVYTNEDLQLVQAFANQTAVAIRNARQTHLTRQALQETKTLYLIGSILAKTPDIQLGIQQALGECLRALHLEQGTITLLNGGGQSGTLYALYKNGQPQPVDGASQLISMVYQEIIQSGEPLVVTDAVTDPLLADIRELVSIFNIKSLLLVPLLVRGKVIGLMGADAINEPRHFSKREVSLAQAIADQIATALENSRLLEKEQQQRQIAESLRQVAMVLNSSLNPQEVISKILEQLRQVIRYDSAGLFLVEGDDLVLTGGANLPQEIMGYRISLLSQIKTAQVYRQKRPIITEDVRVDPNWETESTSGKIISWMAAPLLVGNVAIGVLTLDSFKANTYNQDDAQVLQVFANQAAIAVHNARLFESTRVALDQAETLYAASLALSVSMNLQEVLEIILTELRKVVPYDSASVTRRERDQLQIIAGAGFKNPAGVIGLTMNLKENDLMQELVTQGEPIIIADTVKLPGFELDPDLELSIRGWMGVPLLFGDQVIGSLGIDKKETEFYTPEHARLAMAFAAQAAIAIENARLFHEEQRQREVSDQALTELKATQNQLVVQEKMASLGMLTAGIAHEIKNPLNFVTSFAKLSIELAQDLQGFLDDENLNKKTQLEINKLLKDLQYNAASINEEGQRANSIVQSMLLHSRLGTSESQETDLNALIAEAVNLAFHSMRAKDTDFDITITTSYDPALQPLVVNPQDLSRVFVNLVNNAYDATREKKLTIGNAYKAKLSVSTKDLPKTVEIRIRDNGPGINPKKKDKLFTPFFTTKPAGQGTGLGLSISYDIIVQEHRGKITVDTQEGHYTEFIISLPKTRKG